ncbi:MMPL family transporter [Microbacterium sp. ARD31]|uniref:MMPL family transporter n=1 Tax=Microbacterium sp. ARD31 TaxID=2962576 RepID=UPI0028817A98|nr:MMPL family transporter [Microbacterium sp. ARD31]MDT0184842.1 MMPL family transporter [Microbacterium sp. ARD31]
MASLLYRLGGFSARRPWIVITAWLVILLSAVGAWLGFRGVLTSEITVPGTATEQVQDRLVDILGGGEQGSGTVVVHTSDGTALTSDTQAEISTLISEVDAVEGVDSVVDPFVTSQQRTAQEQQLSDAVAQISDAHTDLDAGQAQLDAAVAQARAAGAYEQVAEQLTQQQAALDDSAAELNDQETQIKQGQALAALSEDIRLVSEDSSTAIISVTFEATSTEVSDSTTEEIRTIFDDADLSGVETDYSAEIAPAAAAHGASAEAVGIVIAAIVLFIMLGTIVMAGLPLLTALIGVGVSMLTVLAFSSLVEMSDTTVVLGLMLGLAVGIDYTLFIVDRHRRQLRRGLDIRESIALANGTSGSAVVFAGATVIIALMALWVTGIPFLGMMGTAGAAAILAAVLVAVTLTPAVLSLIGRRALPKRIWTTLADGHVTERPVKEMSTTRAIVTTVAAVAALGVIALPAIDMRLGLPDGSSEAHDSTQYRAFAAIEEAFGPGQNSPLLVVADLPSAVADEDLVSTNIAIAETLAAQEGVAAVAPAGGSDDNEVLLYQLLPTEGPQGEVTEQLVHDLRSLQMTNSDVAFSVAGAASGNIDISEKIADALPPYLMIVVGLSFLILILVFRSLLVPLIATGGFVLSLLASLGAVTAVYQFGWLGSVFGVESARPVLSILPTLLVGILFGLAMDYQLFIGSGIREAYAHGSPARLAVAKGVNGGRAVVTAAAIIMAAVFAGFIFGDATVVRPLGFGLAFGVLVDAFVVRMLLVPAVLHLCGNAAWWLPKWLDRLLPDVDIEGARLGARVSPTP